MPPCQPASPVPRLNGLEEVGHLLVGRFALGVALQDQVGRGEPVRVVVGVRAVEDLDLEPLLAAGTG